MQTLSYIGINPGIADTCDNLALMCIDFRMHGKICDALTYGGYRDFDLIALPGGSKALVDEDSRPTVFAAIEQAIAVHKVKRLIIADHVDCKAHGGSERFTNSDEETTMHEQALRQAAEIVKSRFPELEVVLVYAGRDRVGVVATG